MFALLPSSYDRVWTRVYFYFDGVINSHLKFNLYWGGFSHQFGGLIVEGGALGWSFYDEWSAVVHGLVSLSGLLNGWHSLEVDYWRVGDPAGDPSVAFWLDGVQLTGGRGSPPAPGYWSGGRLHAGSRSNSLKLSGGVGWIDVLNAGNSVNANVWVDKVSVSTLGRIGQ
jgi:hypothetical protein